MQEKFKGLVEQSTKILVISHISPDPDAISSMLLLGTTIEANYPDKQIIMSTEELPEGLEFLHGYQKIIKQPLEDAIGGVNLIIMVDAMNFGRCTRNNWESITKEVQNKNIPLAIIDHHEQNGIEKSEAYINRGYPAAVQEVYAVLFNDLKLQKPSGYAETSMVGLYSDTGNFTYLNDTYKETLGLIAELIKAGVSIEKVKNKLHRYTKDHLTAVCELGAHLEHEGTYTYSYLTDEYVRKWRMENKSLATLRTAIKLFLDQYIRNIDDRAWGFIVYPDPMLGDNAYSVSFRSVGGVVDVAFIANTLNGGGHKAAAGARVQAANVEEAINLVKNAITKSIA